MASAGIRFPGNCHLLNRQWSENVNFFARKPSSVSFCVDSDCSRWKRLRICSSASVHAGMAIENIENNKISAGDASVTNAAVVYEKLDEWMKDSVVEIVKNLREAPLLVHVYDKSEKKTTMKTEKSVEEETWTGMMNSWRKRDTPVPEGVIFVEQLEEKDEEEEVEKDVAEAITRAWGIVVQGKGVDCGPVCYMLKTSRVGSGVGVCCTHFCLMKVKSFRESTRSQLKNFWLLQGQ